MISRRGFLKGLLGGTLAGLFTGGYALAEAALQMRVQTWAVQPKGWPRGHRMRIVMVSDLHAAGLWMDVARVEQVVALANAQGGDLIALMGDYRATHRYQPWTVSVDVFAPILAQLKAPLGVFAVMGNHDWYDDLLATAKRQGPCRSQVVLEAAGIPVLANQAIRLHAPGGDFWLVGTESQSCFSNNEPQNFVGMADLPKALAQVVGDEPAILLAHEPDQFVDVPDRIALTLSGHTHGGQIRFGLWAPVVPSRFGARFLYGPYREGNRDLVVSGGIGCSGVPLRLGRPPEITVVDLS